MRSEATCLTFAVLFTLQMAAAPPLAFACPPSRTWTTGPDEEAGVVLAEGDAGRGADGGSVRGALGPGDSARRLLPRHRTAGPAPACQIERRGQPGRRHSTGVLCRAWRAARRRGRSEFEDQPFRLFVLPARQRDRLDPARAARALRRGQRRADRGAGHLRKQPGPRPEQIGGRIALTGDGYLFIALGDRWDSTRAQDLSDTAGSIVRIRTDGTVPDDNPFSLAEGARPEIWSYGHRNPQGLAFDRATGELWADEHGPQGGDELNRIVRGGNHGWPIATFGVDYTASRSP